MKLLESERITIRHLSHDDLETMSLILSDPDVMRHSVRGVMDKDATLGFINECIESYKESGFGPWALIDKESSELIGFSGINKEPLGESTVTNLGYRLAKRYWGKGLATEAVRSVLDYAFNKLCIEAVVAIIEPENLSSIKVAEKVGFDMYEFLNFHNSTVHKYSLSRHQWQRV